MGRWEREQLKRSAIGCGILVWSSPTFAWAHVCGDGFDGACSSCGYSDFDYFNWSDVRVNNSWWWKDEQRERRARSLLRDQRRRANLAFRNPAPILRMRQLKREDKRKLRTSAILPCCLADLSYAALR